jgi:predicted enzyme related to lactoylglutathione lyase
MDPLTPNTSASVRPATAVPTSRTVRSLDRALRLVQRFGGSVTSETRTAPGIGSWALVTDAHGNDLVLWENAAPALG